MFQNRFAPLSEDCYFETVDDWDSFGYLRIGSRSIFSCMNLHQRKSKSIKRIKESEDNETRKSKKKNQENSANLFDILREHPEEDISKILTRLEISRIPRKSLQKCKKCNFKKRKCTLDPSSCKAAKMFCMQCKRFGHFPKSIYCKSNKKVHVQCMKNIASNAKQSPLPLDFEQWRKDVRLLVTKRIHQIELQARKY